MREVAIIGIGQTPIAEHWDESLRYLAAEAIHTALVDAGRNNTEALFVGNMLSGSLNQQENLGVLISDWVGLRFIETQKVEVACASGAAAFRSAMIAVASGEIDSAIAVGVEKMTDSKPSEVTSALATAADADWESAQGLTFVAINALIMKRYMYQYGWKHADFAQFSVNAHANAVHNPYSRLPFKITLEDYINSRMVSDPINLMDAAPIGDGAAAVMLVPAESIDRYSSNRSKLPVRVIASASATDSFALHDRKNPLWLTAAEISARKCYSQAVLEPQDIDFFEIHDAFSIMSVLSLEACGFSEPGQGPRLALDGDISLSGKLPITTMGGLKARGHPVGATGIYQIVEVVQQLRYESGKNQVDPARNGMTQSIGGSGSTVLTHLFRRW
jgi:acetyl-CoA C-acetyltransferase